MRLKPAPGRTFLHFLHFPTPTTAPTVLQFIYFLRTLMTPASLCASRVSPFPRNSTIHTIPSNSTNPWKKAGITGISWESECLFYCVTHAPGRVQTKADLSTANWWELLLLFCRKARYPKAVPRCRWQQVFHSYYSFICSKSNLIL